jgi:hypothetical protein
MIFSGRRALMVPVLFVAVLAPIQAGASAGTTEFSTGVIPAGYGGAGDPTWTPRRQAATPGDTIVWHFGANSGGHGLEIFETDGEPIATAGAPTGDVALAFEGGTGWFRCPVHSHVGPQGICVGMCGSFTSAGAPDAPIIESPTPDEAVDGRTLRYSGRAAPHTIVMLTDFSDAYPTGNGPAPVMVGASGTWSFDLSWLYEGALPRGAHRTVVTTEDALGRQVSAEVRYRVADDRPPTITTTSPDPTVGAGPVVLRGRATDDTMMRSIEARLYDVAGRFTGSVDATCGDTCRAPGVDWEVNLAGTPAGYHYVRLVAKDIFLNEAQIAVRVIKLT